MADILVEDGTIVSGANSYVAQDYVTNFCEEQGLSEWVAAGDTEKDAAIFRGMAYVESKGFKGVKSEADNPLKWPREGVYDEDGYAVENNAIPENLKRAASRAAYEEVKSSGTLEPSLDYGIKREKIDIIETEYFQSAKAPQTFFQAVDNYLKGLVKGITSVDVVRT